MIYTNLYLALFITREYENTSKDSVSLKEDFNFRSSSIFFYSLKKKIMCMGVLPAYMSQYHMVLVPEEARRGHEIPRDWN